MSMWSFPKPLLMLLCIVTTSAFSSTLSSVTRPLFGRRVRTAGVKPSTTISSTASAEVTSVENQEQTVGAPPTWEDLTSTLEKVKASTESSPAPLVTLYRDTNGWCPFCERVWLALKIKNIPYQEVLVNLQNKPDWFLAMVPTGLVPAVLFHDDLINEDFSSSDAENENEKDAVQPERRLIWESLDIMKELDKSFPQTPQLVREDDADYLEARNVATAMTTAVFQYVYAGRNTTLTEEDKAQRKVECIAALDQFNDFLGKTDGPFALGSEISGIDVEIVPTLERWRYQLPLTNGMDILDGGKRKFIQRWYDAMDQYEPYTNRVKGDEYSWTAVASTFMRLFGGASENGISDEMKEGIERADEAASVITGKFAELNLDDNANKASFAIEAASKIISNHEAIVSDCTNADPKSQKELARSNDADAADVVLRTVAHNLLAQHPVVEGEVTITPEFEGVDQSKDAVTSARTVAARLCVPRDMGGPAASLLRKELTKTADSIEKSFS